MIDYSTASLSASILTSFLSSPPNTSTKEAIPESQSPGTSSSLITMAFVMVKVLYLALIFFLAILAYYKKQNGITKETMLFVFFLVKLVAIVIYDLVGKYLLMLYFMLLASQFAIFWSFLWLLTYPSAPYTQQIKEKLAPLTYFLKLALLFSCIVAFIPFIGVSCSRSIYPLAFVFLTLQYVVSNFATFLFYFKYYDLEKPEQYDRLISDSTEQDLTKFLTKQVRIFFIINTYLCLVQITMTIFGLFSASEDLVCYGGAWDPVSFRGEFFSTVHILIIIFQGVMIEQMFYQIPKSHGHFCTSSQGDYPLLTDEEEPQCHSI